MVYREGDGVTPDDGVFRKSFMKMFYRNSQKQRHYLSPGFVPTGFLCPERDGGGLNRAYTEMRFPKIKGAVSQIVRPTPL
jgi:hypothetical protein